MKDILLLARTGEVRDGLLALLAALPGAGPVSITDNYDSAIEYLSRHCPALVLVVTDSQIPDRKSLRGMKDSCPRMRILALVTEEDDRQIAAACGVDGTLMSGVIPSELSSTIEALLLENR